MRRQALRLVSKLFSSADRIRCCGRCSPDECLYSLGVRLGARTTCCFLLARPTLWRPLIPQLGEGAAIIGTIVPPEELGGPGRVAVIDDSREGAFAVRWQRLGPLRTSTGAESVTRSMRLCIPTVQSKRNEHRPPHRARTPSPATFTCSAGRWERARPALLRGLARGLGVEGYVRSPTFVLMTRHHGRLTLAPHRPLPHRQPGGGLGLGAGRAAFR